MYLDLHVHSKCSDGTFSADELVVMARELGLEFLSITDHDSVRCQEAAVRAAKKMGVRYITGVEISCEFATMMDILGYGIDPSHAELKGTLETLVEYRNRRNLIIIEILRDLGLDISLDEVLEEAGGDVVGRPHFARVLLKKGYVGTIQEAFDRYLAKGAKAYVDKKRLKMYEAISLIKKAGGVPVLAHPGLMKLSFSELDDLLSKLKEHGLVGLECFYSKHSTEETTVYLALARKHGLYISAGSDFHGNNKPDVPMGMEIPLERFNGRFILDLL